jgi:non-canonical poly(A) RNA polymerase PAPD5/7
LVPLSPLANSIRLHKEIMDFYHFVKPRDFEQFIRTRLVEELRSNVKQFFNRTADIRTFGSFPAGLYLPTSDMDLVCVSDTFMQGGRMILDKKSSLYKFDVFLKNCNLSLRGETEVIAKAKVPLVKYVDRTTGLKIDVSFENDTGLIANRTFQEWKATFPAMPILVTLIKHLLAMRGLNEPVNGGIGGFSVTCLVVSLLQNMPQVQSGSMVPEHHLGEILMEFLDLYGNQFNIKTTAIQLNPPGYIPKVSQLEMKRCRKLILVRVMRISRTKTSSPSLILTDKATTSLADPRTRKQF